MQYRQQSGRFGKKSYILHVFVIMFVSLTALGAWLSWTSKPVTINNPKPASMLATVAKAVEKPDYEKRVKQVKQEVIDDLSLGCETKGLKDPDGALIFDSNNEASIGRFQFQRKTVIHYVKLFEGRDITNHEAIAIAIDPVKATALAEKILFTEENGWQNWLTCGKKLNLATKIALINEIIN